MAVVVMVLAAMVPVITRSAEHQALRVHNIYEAHMVIQRDRPITIWGWAQTGHLVFVQFGQAKAQVIANVESGRREVTFPARPVNTIGQTLTMTSDHKTIVMENILIDDIWVMNGQSNMAFGLGKTYGADLDDPTYRAFLPAYETRIPGLHPLKKREHGVRAARWALNRIYHAL
jgi:sialate O-acetylesterase